MTELNVQSNVYADIEEFVRQQLEAWKNEAALYYNENLDEDATGPWLDLTFSTDGKQWGYQTGDNSYTGGAYGLPYWAITGVGPDTTIETVMSDIRQQWDEY